MADAKYKNSGEVTYMRLIKIYVSVIAMFGTIFLSGCSFQANPNSMIVTPKSEIIIDPRFSNITRTTASVDPKLSGKITVTKISGGKKSLPAPFGVSHVDNDALRKALEDSLSAYGYLASSPNKAKYKLEAKLLGIDWRGLGARLMSVHMKAAIHPDVDVTSSIEFKITDANTEKEYVTRETTTVNPSDAFVYDKSMQIAVERTIKLNIQNLLRYLAKAKVRA